MSANTEFGLWREFAAPSMVIGVADGEFKLLIEATKRLIRAVKSSRDRRVIDFGTNCQILFRDRHLSCQYFMEGELDPDYGTDAIVRSDTPTLPAYLRQRLVEVNDMAAFIINL